VGIARPSTRPLQGRAYRQVVTLDYPTPALSDEVLRLRRWSLDDLDCVQEAGSDPAIPAHTTVPSLWTVDAGRAFIHRQGERAKSGEGLSLAIHHLELDRAVGLVSLMLRPQVSVIGLGYWVVPSVRHRGLAGRAVTLASDWAIGAGGYARVEAWVEPDNQPSHSVLRAAGFELEGRLRSFLAIGDSRSDALVYSRLAASVGRHIPPAR